MGEYIEFGQIDDVDSVTRIVCENYKQCDLCEKYTMTHQVPSNCRLWLPPSNLKRILMKIFYVDVLKIINDYVNYRNEFHICGCCIEHYYNQYTDPMEEYNGTYSHCQLYIY